MKRCLLYLLLICGFLGALIPGASTLVEKTEQLQHTAKSAEFSTAFLNHPHTELEIYSASVCTTGHTFRVQPGPGYLSLSNFRLPDQAAFIAEHVSDQGNFSCKEYLTHIYPSYNFW